VAVEAKLVGRGLAYTGVPFFLIGTLVEPWPRAFVIAPIVGVLAAIGLYRFTYMRAVQEGIRHAEAPPTPELESGLATRGRAALMVTLATPLVLLGAASDEMAAVGALISCNGAAVWMVARRVMRWEIETGNVLLRRPRRRKERGDRGFLDPRDFYVVAAGDPTGAGAYAR
jgi:hypothetical protein